MNSIRKCLYEWWKPGHQNNLFASDKAIDNLERWIEERFVEHEKRIKDLIFEELDRLGLIK